MSLDRYSHLRFERPAISLLQRNIDNNRGSLTRGRQVRGKGRPWCQQPLHTARPRQGRSERSTSAQLTGRRNSRDKRPLGGYTVPPLRCGGSHARLQAPPGACQDRARKRRQSLHLAPLTPFARSSPAAVSLWALPPRFIFAFAHLFPDDRPAGTALACLIYTRRRPVAAMRRPNCGRALSCEQRPPLQARLRYGGQRATPST